MKKLQKDGALFYNRKSTMNLKSVLTAVIFVCIALVLVNCGGTELKRDYSSHEKIKAVAPRIFPPDDSSWIKVDDTTRRKVFFNDRLTLEIVQTTKSGLADNIIPAYRYNDLIGYVLEGNAIVTVGKDTRQIGPGGAFVVPSNVPYDVIPASEKTTILNVYTPVREDLRPVAPHTPRFPENEIKSITYKWFSLFDEQAPVENFLSFLADTGLAIQIMDKKILSGKDFQDWYAAWYSTVDTYSSKVESLTVSFDPNTGHYNVSTVVSWNIRTLDGKKKEGQSQVNIVFADFSDDVPKIIEYTAAESKTQGAP